MYYKFIFYIMCYIIITVKTLIVCLIAIAIRGTLPRYRFDQITQINWKHFIFIWLGYLIFNISYFMLFL